MFSIYESKSLTTLCEQFLDLVKKNQPEDPFSSNWIIVQNREMQEWLTLNQAKRDIISANNHFVFPSEFIWKLYRFYDDKLPNVLPSDKNPLLWSVFDVLQKSEFVTSEFKIDSDTDQMQFFQLSKVIADVFDQYQVYRPEQLMGWEKGLKKTSHYSEHWQMELWNELNTRWNQISESRTRPEIFNELKSLMISGNYPIKKLPQNLWVFSLPHVSQPFADVLSLLSNHINIHQFYCENSSDKTEGKLAQKLLKAHSNNKEVLTKSFNKGKTKSEKFTVIEIEGVENKLLKQIQNLISENDVSSDMNTNDDSFSIHSCHNKKREVEVLKDALLSALNSEKQLKPDECLILVPSLEEYGNIIHQIFENGNYGESLPVSNVYPNKANQISRLLIEIFHFLNSDFKITDLLDILENPVISKKWNISGEELAILRKWMSDLKVHRGIDDSPHSLANGIDRLLLGYVMQPDKFKEFRLKTAYDKVSGTDSLALVAKFSSFFHALESGSQLVSGSDQLKGWLRKTKLITEQLMLTNGAEDGVSELLSSIESLNEQVDFIKSDHKIESNIFISWLKDNLLQKDTATSGFGHGVTISEYVPNRNIPYKFVGILGLNENVIPSTKHRPEFDLIYQFPEPGDRIEKWEQQYLFYDMIQSAQDKLHLSYIGADQKTNNERDPSILLQQLIYEAKNSGLEFEITTHKLHGFDSYYLSEDEPKTFSKTNKRIAELLSKSERRVSVVGSIEKILDEKKEIERLDINQLIRFYTDPSKYICFNELGISNSDYDVEPEERESFKLSGLEGYFLKEYLSEAFLDSRSENDLKKLARASNLIPEGLPGDSEFGSYEILINQLEDLKEQLRKTEEKNIDIELNVEDVLLEGTIDQIYDDRLIQQKLGRLKAKHLLEIWIKHVLMSSSGSYKSSVFYFDRNNSLKEEAIPERQSDWENELSTLLNHFLKAANLEINSIIPPETAKAYAEEFIESQDRSKAIEKALSKWDAGNERSSSEKDDYYNSLIFPSNDFLYSESFHKNALQIWSPLLNSLKANK